MMTLLVFLLSFWDYSYNIETEFTYDNNIFNYSSEYIDDFMNQIRPYRFPFDTYDDLRIGVNLSLLFRKDFVPRRTTTFNAYISLNHHLINQQKDYQKLIAGIRQSFGTIALKVSYEVIPTYLIRYYRDPHAGSTDYIGCSVAYQTVAAKMTIHARPNLAVDLYYNRRRDDYIDEFNTFDSHANLFGLCSSINLNSRLKFETGYEIKLSSTDTSGLVTGISDDTPDGSYTQHKVNAGLNWSMMLLLPTFLFLDYEYTFRNYSAESHMDSLHFGRQDHSHRFSVTSEMKLFAGMYLTMSYLTQWRNATSEVFSDIERLKNYGKHRLGAGVRLYY